MFTVYMSLMWLYLPLLFLFLSFTFTLSPPSALPSLPHLLPVSSLHLSSAPSGGSVASDAASRGQPFISVTGGNLQTALRQEGNRA